jgi:hypothetical protein
MLKYQKLHLQQLKHYNLHGTRFMQILQNLPLLNMKQEFLQLWKFVDSNRSSIW